MCSIKIWFVSQGNKLGIKPQSSQVSRPMNCFNEKALVAFCFRPQSYVHLNEEGTS